MATYDIAIATCDPMPEADHDAEALVAALRAAGLTVQEHAWNKPGAPFAGARLTLVRSTWDYFLHYEDFLKWIDQREGRIVNAAAVLRWNTHKRYLRELDEAGFATVPTVLVPKGTKVTLHQLLTKKEWLSAVAKPAVGGGSYLTKRVSGAQADDVWFQERVAERDMLLQPYMASVQTQGERSLIYLNGTLSHVIRKRPRFAGESESTSLDGQATEAEKALADRVLRYVVTRLPAGQLLYARVDLMFGDQGEPLISELELTEPSLYFNHFPAGMNSFVEGIKSWLAPLRPVQPEAAASSGALKP